MNQTLKGVSIMLTRSKQGNQTWAVELASLGATIYCLDTIETTPLRLDTKSQQALNNLSTFDWLIFTSAAGVRYFDNYKTTDELPNIAAVGEKTATAALLLGYKVKFVPTHANGATLGKKLPDVTGKNVLVARAKNANTQIIHHLKERGAIVVNASLYKTVPITAPDSATSKILLDNSINYIIFASPSAVHGFQSRLSEQSLKKAYDLPVIAIGPSTETALQEADFHNIIVAHSSSLQSIVGTIAQAA